jgi:hypothetical protein
VSGTFRATLERGIVAVIVEEGPPAIYAVEHVIDPFA